ncbi:MAG: linoleoyl-CoA desaturase [Flavobacteriales bacterium]|jgi:linoleoyl-CoA desaturase
MSVRAVKFNVQDRPEFFKELRKRVNAHFKEKNISKNANTKMKIKTAFMVALYFVPMVLLISGIVSSLWGMVGMFVLMSLGMSGIGLSVMHDANHGSYSKNRKVNKALGYLVNFIGGYPINWIIQHNVLHHSFTNVEGFDEDIEQNVMRFSPSQERKGIFKYQAFYAPFFYGLMTIYWLLGKDFEALVRYDKMGLLEGQGTTLKKSMTEVVINKVWYMIITVALPIYAYAPSAWWHVVLAFLLMHFISGLILALVFQPAHVIQETEFFLPDEETSVENNWAIHQMLTTANFANNSTLFSWYVGGLNFQIEHHLFPNICHIHYKDISSIVKQTAKEFNVPYYEHETFLDALKSHFKLLHSLGTGSYDDKLAKSS